MIVNGKMRMVCPPYSEVVNTILNLDLAKYSSSTVLMLELEFVKPTPCSSMAKEDDAAKATEETMVKHRQDQDGYGPKETILTQ
ncbi:hypothetical protein L195_g013147 [Trifolium pratense]|uniref:Uncharacterized protein n=1 Tax=Trifolium pratense TaxID=57577 RepID=A0A2K3PMB5_TRIPR|nr:hypothetical protein L195_g013147 [Trifolium pratense]